MFVLKRFLALLLVFLFPVLPALGETVTASFFPVYLMARNLTDGIEGLEVHSLTAPDTGCLHDYQLSTGDLKALEDSKLFLICGAGMEAFLPMVQRAYPDLPLADASAGLTLLPSESGETEFNAHIWLDPKNAVQMVENLRAALAELLPESAERINQNAREYTARLTALDQELAAAISALPHKQIVTFHEAFPYFAAAYGLEVVAVVALEPDEPISPRMLAQVADKVRAAGNPPLFSEPQYEGAALRAIAQETGAPAYELDPLVTGDGALTAYEDTMRRNLAVLEEALGEP